MLTLAIETSTRKGEIALSRDGEMLSVRSLGPVSQRHATTLFVEIDAAFREHGLSPGELTRIGVSLGPGSFTGLRIGIVAAKTLAYSLKCELCGIDTFLAIAHAAPVELEKLYVVGDAQRGDLFVGRYESHLDGGWKQASPIEVLSIEDFLKSLSSEDHVSGPGLQRYKSEVGQKANLVEPALREPHALAVCQLSQSQGVPLSDPWSLVPFYLRKSTAEEKWDQEQSNV